MFSRVFQNSFCCFLWHLVTLQAVRALSASSQLINIPNVPYQNLLSVSGHLPRPTPPGCNINLSNKQLNHLPLSVVAVPAVVVVAVLARAVANMCRPVRRAAPQLPRSPRLHTPHATEALPRHLGV